MKKSDSFIDNGKAERYKGVNTARDNAIEKELVKHNHPFLTIL